MDKIVPELKPALLSALSEIEDIVDQAFRRIEKNELAVLSIGDVTRRSMLVCYGLPEDIRIKELKAAIQAIGDPSTTLLIPVPIEYATSTQVTVQGVDGVALGDNTGVGSGVVWVKDGYVYVVAGSIKRDDAVAIANNLN